MCAEEHALDPIVGPHLGSRNHNRRACPLARPLTAALPRCGVLTVHADRGSAMRSKRLAQLLGGLGVEQSFSRPRVSGDNAFSESHFKTLKYQPDSPDRFAALTHGRAWCQEFFGWYNDSHQHSGFALFTPADVFYDRADEAAARWQVALDAAYAAHLERSACCAQTPASVAINPLSLEEATPEASVAPSSSHEVVALSAIDPRSKRHVRSHPTGEIRNSRPYAIPS